MAEPQRYKGIAHNGKIELEPGATVPDGAEVIVLFRTAKPAEAAEKAKLEARERLFALMAKGVDLGGGPYFRREEVYGETGRPR